MFVVDVFWWALKLGTDPHAPCPVTCLCYTFIYFLITVLTLVLCGPLTGARKILRSDPGVVADSWPLKMPLS